MAGLPQKSIKGANLKKWLIEAVDGIIDYLKSGIYLVPGPGISIERKPSGIVISATKPSVSASPSVKASASSVQDISATVTGGTGGTGGTATITLSGSTSSVPVVAGSNVNITGGTNGEVIIGATGSTGTVGFPDFGTEPIVVSGGTVYPVSADMWLVGTIGIYKTSSSSPYAYVNLKIYNGTTDVLMRTINLFSDQGVYAIFSDWNTYVNFSVPVCFPIKGGTKIEVIKEDSASFSLSLFYT